MTPGTTTTESALGGGTKVIVALSADTVMSRGCTETPAMLRPRGKVSAPTPDCCRLSGITRSPAGSVKLMGSPSRGAELDTLVPRSMIESVLTRKGVANSNTTAGLLSTPTFDTRAGPSILANGMNVSVVASRAVTTGSAPLNVSTLLSVKNVPAGAVIETVSPKSGRLSVISASSSPGTEVTS